MDALNRNELEALRILWDHGEAKPADIEARFSWPIDNGTLRSVLRVLVDKGLVARRKLGKAYYYRTKKPRATVMAGMARQMAHVFSGGSAADLIAQLIRTEKLSPEDLAELRRIAQTESKSPPKRPRKGKKS